MPNHGYALLVDGGTYNGQTIAAIGLVKAAHLYWRAQSVYQTPTTDFDDHADALEASCADLIGQSLNGLSTSSTPAGPSGPVDHGGRLRVGHRDDRGGRAAPGSDRAVQLQPALNPNTPSLCANQKNAPVIYEEDFEDGLGGWTLDEPGRLRRLGASDQLGPRHVASGRALGLRGVRRGS